MTYKLMLIDDSQENLLVLKIGAQKHGFDTVACSTIDEAFARLENEASFDVIISDYNVNPNQTCLQLLNLVRKSLPNCLIVVISGSFLPLSLVDKLCDVFYQKPFTMNKVYKVILSILHNRK